MKEKAVEYFEKASALDNIDATYNLGHMHFSGDYPGKDRDMVSEIRAQKHIPWSLREPGSIWSWANGQTERLCRPFQ